MLRLNLRVTHDRVVEPRGAVHSMTARGMDGRFEAAMAELAGAAAAAGAVRSNSEGSGKEGEEDEGDEGGKIYIRQSNDG
eukprot:COSAG06_NODE_2320_length_7089_cov_5.139628_8_plen_80_part_00